MWQCTTNYLTWFDMWMHIFIFEILKLEGLYVGDLLYTRDLYYFLWLLVTVQFSQLKTRWNSYSYSPSLCTSWFYHSHADSVWTSVFSCSVVLIKVNFIILLYPPKSICVHNIYRGIIHNSLKVEITQLNTHRKDKQNMM